MRGALGSKASLMLEADSLSLQREAPSRSFDLTLTNVPVVIQAAPPGIFFARCVARQLSTRPGARRICPSPCRYVEQRKCLAQHGHGRQHAPLSSAWKPTLQALWLQTAPLLSSKSFHFQKLFCAYQGVVVVIPLRGDDDPLECEKFFFSLQGVLS